MPFATHFPNDDQPPWHLSFLEFIGLVINCLWLSFTVSFTFFLIIELPDSIEYLVSILSCYGFTILFIIKYKVLYMSSSFWLLGVESRDFSHAENEKTAC